MTPAWETVKKWFGYTLHLVVDARYELPVAFAVAKAAVSEVVTARGVLQGFEEQHAQVWERCQAMCMDRAYDDGKLIKELWDAHAVLPIIDIRDCWKDGEKKQAGRGDRERGLRLSGHGELRVPAHGNPEADALRGI